MQTIRNVIPLCLGGFIFKFNIDKLRMKVILPYKVLRLIYKSIDEFTIWKSVRMTD
jgi:hypothetical protein